MPAGGPLRELLDSRLFVAAIVLRSPGYGLVVQANRNVGCVQLGENLRVGCSLGPRSHQMRPREKGSDSKGMLNLGRPV